jgi:hypothetical protein
MRALHTMKDAPRGFVHSLHEGVAPPKRRLHKLKPMRPMRSTKLASKGRRLPDLKPSPQGRRTVAGTLEEGSWVHRM